ISVGSMSERTPASCRCFLFRWYDRRASNTTHRVCNAPPDGSLRKPDKQKRGIMSSKIRVTISVFAVLMCASIASAQGMLRIDANDYGINSVNYLIIPGAEFIPSDSTTGYNKPYLTLERTGGGGSEFTHALN